jgi:hypothetical protein
VTRTAPDLANQRGTSGFRHVFGKRGRTSSVPNSGAWRRESVPDSMRTQRSGSPTGRAALASNGAGGVVTLWNVATGGLMGIPSSSSAGFLIEKITEPLPAESMRAGCVRLMLRPAARRRRYAAAALIRRRARAGRRSAMIPLSPANVALSQLSG